MKNLRILIPAKAFLCAKSRLAPVLDPAARAKLCEELLLATLKISVAIAPTTVVTSDSRISALTLRNGAECLLEGSQENLNISLSWAREKISPTDDVLIMPIDLPYLSEQSLGEFLARTRSLTIVADRHQCGTNLLFLPSQIVQKFRFAFGENSAQAHQREGLRLGVEAKLVALPEAEFDLDSPADYAQYLQRPFHTGGRFSENALGPSTRSSLA
jgi:2-phospho-L-lactate guanylyltransferase